MEITSKDERGGAPVLDIDSKSIVGGGVEDAFGEDRATEDQPVTPWTISVASGYSLLRDLHYNKGLAFTEKERCSLLAWSVTTHGYNSKTLQVKKMMHNIHQYQDPLQKYMAMMDLQERNESCSTSFSLTMLRNFSRLFTLQLLRKDSRGTEKLA